ncbi:hypothetical protein OIU77_021465 [Salix suchowensis]|uniref:Uncharacterized protein n=1 Tax=Salix suchowensis TaxID=1278906 RepID=A0ABQ9CBS6_9ROSI|nr:hypothetical protein OIU77_021465 [Salix suchowensis]
MEPAVETYAFLGMLINETIDNKVRKMIREEARNEIKLYWVFEDRNNDVDQFMNGVQFQTFEKFVQYLLQAVQCLVRCMARQKTSDRFLGICITFYLDAINKGIFRNTLNDPWDKSNSNLITPFESGDPGSLGKRKFKILNTVVDGRDLVAVENTRSSSPMGSDDD